MTLAVPAQPAGTAPKALRRKTIVVPVLVFALLAALPLASLAGSASYLLDLFTRVMIFAIAACALDLLIGYAALVTFGQAAFIGLGAYAVGILAAHGVTDALIALPAALGAVGAVRRCSPVWSACAPRASISS